MTTEAELQWVIDDERTRGFHGKTLHMFKDGIDHGIFLMHVTDTGPNGELNPGFVIVNLELLPEKTNKLRERN